MSLFANYRADRLIAEVKSSGNPGSPLAQKALEKLVALGPSAIEPIVDALTTAEKRETLAYVEALSRLIDAKTLPQLLKTMSEANGRAISGIAWAGRLPGSQPTSQSFRIDPPESPLREVALDIASFTADSAKRETWRYCVSQSLRDREQEFIACFVPKAVIDGLEAIQV